MRFCKDHWQELKEAIDARGLGHLVAKSGEEAARRFAAELDQAHGPGDGPAFEPLVGALMMITHKALGVAEREMRMHEQHGDEVCPLCFLIGHCRCGLGLGCDYAKWITYASNAAQARARDLGLIPRAS